MRVVATMLVNMHGMRIQIILMGLSLGGVQALLGVYRSSTTLETSTTGEIPDEGASIMAAVYERSGRVVVSDLVNACSTQSAGGHCGNCRLSMLMFDLFSGQV